MLRYRNRYASALILGFALAALVMAGRAQSEVREIKISAKKYEYTPSEIHVKQGEHVRLLITATDRKHGFEIKALGIKTELEKAKETVVEFDAPQPGEYEMHCSSFCGFGHGGMKGKLIVEAAS